jgi:hypothetical protein
MTRYLILAAGLAGHMILLGVLIARGRSRRFPFFTLLILFEILRSLSISFIFVHLKPATLHLASTTLEIVDLLLEFSVLGELVFVALRRLHAVRRITWPLLLLASGALLVTRLAPVSHYTGRTSSLLLHFFLEVLLLEWALVLAFLLRPLDLRWRSHVTAISFGFGAYAAALLFAGGYFRVGREMRDYIFFAYFRVGVYLLVVLWWILSLWRAEPSITSRDSRRAMKEA